MQLGHVEPLLGLPGAWVGPEEPADHYATRVGGLPQFPGTTPPVEYQAPVCGVCGCPLSLVHQVSNDPGLRTAISPCRSGRDQPVCATHFLR